MAKQEISERIAEIDRILGSDYELDINGTVGIGEIENERDDLIETMEHIENDFSRYFG